MILTILKSIQYDLDTRQDKEPGQKAALENLRRLVGQIDHEAEVIPLGNRERLLRTFRSLKGEPLTDQEILLIDRILYF